MTMLTKAQLPYTGPYSVAGAGRHEGPTALMLKRTMKRAGFGGYEGTEFSEMDDVYNVKLESALDAAFHDGGNGYGEGRWLLVRNLHLPDGSFACDGFSQKLVQAEANALLPQVPDLGPVHRAGRSLLAQDLTHPTDGIPLYPALDDAFGFHIPILAPENLTVTRDSSSHPGDAFYATGQSGIRYWFGHLAFAPSVGRRFAKGETMGLVGANGIGGGPHVHVGINVEGIWGPGAQLAHHDNYTHGAVLIGAQLKMHAGVI